MRIVVFLENQIRVAALCVARRLAFCCGLGVALASAMFAGEVFADIKADDCYHVYYSSGDPGYVCDPNPGGIWWAGVLLKMRGGMARVLTEPMADGGARQRVAMSDGTKGTCTIPNRAIGHTLPVLPLERSGATASGIPTVEVAPGDFSEQTAFDLSVAVDEFNLELAENHIALRLDLKVKPTRNTRIVVDASGLVGDVVGNTTRIGDGVTFNLAYVHYQPGKIVLKANRFNVLRHELAHALGLFHDNIDGRDTLDGLMHVDVSLIDRYTSMNPCELGVLAGAYGTIERK